MEAPDLRLVVAAAVQDRLASRATLVVVALVAPADLLVSQTRQFFTLVVVEVAVTQPAVNHPVPVALVVAVPDQAIQQ